MEQAYKELATAVLLTVVQDFKADLKRGLTYETAWYKATDVAEVWFTASGVNREWFYEKLQEIKPKHLVRRKTYNKWR